jgi:hypothetical protein
MVTNADVLLTSLWIGMASYPFLRRRKTNKHPNQVLLDAVMANHALTIRVMKGLVVSGYSPEEASADLSEAYQEGVDLLQALADYASS